MQILNEYDVAIVGGGLAGLAASIRLARSGYSVIVFEKEKYPFHKVCGEYISLESWDYLSKLGVPLDEWNLPIINTVYVTAPNGNSFTAKLPLGGFGISRYKLDSSLAKIAHESGVHLIEESKVDDIRFDGKFVLHFKSQSITSKVCCAAYGKRSNIDVKWKRNFLHRADKRLDNYVAVKYHVKTNWKENVISLHNFDNGYCGVSKIEDDTCCVCYMTNGENLKKCNNSIDQLEKTVLYKNPHLRTVFSESERCHSFPVTISQINFSKRTQVENHVLMLGDAAGMITPLCGNGMSIALHTSKIACQLIDNFLGGQISREQMALLYTEQWREHFYKRLRTGRLLQRFFGSDFLSNFFVQTFKTFPFFAKPLIKMTHGQPF